MAGTYGTWVTAASDRDQATGSDRSRDRDAVGRARNARPRDGLGRPLPHGAAGVPTVPEDYAAPPAQALADAEQLLHAGRPFQAHEVLEAAWKSAPGPERELWRGLAQVAVGLTHLARGNATGAERLLRRGARHLQPFTAHAPHRIDVPALVAWAGITADAVAANRPPLDAEARRPRLVAPSGEETAQQ